jgi:hypothetical protein
MRVTKIKTVIPMRSISVRDDREVLGFSFTPQDGNALLSSIAAAEWFLYRKSTISACSASKNIFQKI